MALINANAWLLAAHPHIFSQYYGRMSIPEVMDVVPINTDVPVGTSWTDQIVENFSISSVGLLTFTGTAAIFLYAPSFQFTCNKACNLIFKTKLNGVTVSQTPYTITSTNVGVSRLVSRVALVALAPLDTLRIYVQTDTANTTLTIQQGTIALKG